MVFATSPSLVSSRLTLGYSDSESEDSDGESVLVLVLDLPVGPPRPYTRCIVFSTVDLIKG